MAGIALAGCVKNEPVAKDNGSPELITFDAPVVTIPTKATEIVDNYPTTENFAVYALYHEGNFTSFTATGTQLYMNNVKCTYHHENGTTEPTDYWAPENDYYWPKVGKLTFGAYAPYMENGVEWGENGFKFNGFTVGETSANQIDLLYSERVYDKTSSSMQNNNPTYDGIQIPFKHALSSIVFTARAEAYTGYTFTLKEITVNNVIETGTFNQNLKADNTGYLEGKTGPEWEVGTSVKNYVVYNNETGVKLPTGTEEVAGSTTEYKKIYFDGTTTSETAFDKVSGTRKSSLILIPQDLDEKKSEDGSTTKQKVTVTVKYTMQHPNPADDKQSLTEDVTKEFKLAVTNSNPDEDNSNPNLFKWEMGKRYTYNIVIGLEKIYFAPQVDDWMTGEGSFLE